MTNRSASKTKILEGCSLIRFIPSIEQTRLVKYELEMLGLEDEKINLKLLHVQSHTHPDRGTICIVLIFSELKSVFGPFRLPFPKKAVHASQRWDSGGAKLDPRIYP